MIQLAFVKLTSAQEDTTELMVNATSIHHIGVVDGVTFVETPAGCSYVKETPTEIWDKLVKITEYFE
ncbi:hypothetical protein SEA_STEAMY_37 [Mycobacterium phage Steamy]|uniref:Uncharacterized protein n=1 Tax=Mycobacterium phage Steamy TaxID=2250309 RepID=A0A345L0L0_9CAUD|nr:hypothetical protein KIV62_gp64 [Mycobacterium phage Steamy]AXH48812.1 hypothetical protein SEA_STEAMY_37 [Mycobacterium phage Steamy]